MSLSKKQRAFVNAYVKCWNATKAAREAGYTGAYLHTNASKLLQNTTIAEAIQEKIDELTMSADETLVHLSDIARPPVTHADFFTDELFPQLDKEGNVVVDNEGEPIMDSRLTIDWDKIQEYGHLIRTVSFTAAGPKIEFYSRLDALQLIGRNHKLFTDKHDITSGGKEIKTFSIDDLMNAKKQLDDWQADDPNGNTDTDTD